MDIESQLVKMQIVRISIYADFYKSIYISGILQDRTDSDSLEDNFSKVQ